MDSSSEAAAQPTEKDLADLVRRALDSEATHRDRIDRRAAWIVTTTAGMATAAGIVTAVLPKEGALGSLGKRSVLLLRRLSHSRFLLCLSIYAVVQWGHGEGVPHRTLTVLAEGDIGNVKERIRDFIVYESGAALRARERNFKRGRTVAWAARVQVLGIILLLFTVGLILAAVPRA